MSEEQLFPILEFDPAQTAIVEPRRVIKPVDGIPTRAVLCFFQDVISIVVQEYGAKHLFSLHSEIGTHPVYHFELHGQPLVVCHPGLGGPLAAGFMEELIASGCRQFVACGGAGVLDSEIAMGHVVVPSSAVRDEGTSYHYLPPSREVSTDPAVVGAIESVLKRHEVPYLVGKTWTTDAIYRETTDRMQRRKSEGCLTVEMETATFLAVAQFRGVQFGQLLYGGDDLTGTEWDGRSWQRHAGREKLFWLAAEACLEL